jgi:hypothetical protein
MRQSPIDMPSGSTGSPAKAAGSADFATAIAALESSGLELPWPSSRTRSIQARIVAWGASSAAVRSWAPRNING